MIAAIAITAAGVFAGAAVAASSAPAPAAPATSSAAPATSPAAPATSPAAPAAAVRGDNVFIEGKLYSPQALFIVSRRSEVFGRDAIVPQYLDVRPDPAFLPYRLRSERLNAGNAMVTDSSAVSSSPR